MKVINSLTGLNTPEAKTILMQITQQDADEKDAAAEQVSFILRLKCGVVSVIVGCWLVVVGC
jgi:hypothetical protein